MPIPDKAKWQTYKTEFGIPDGLTSKVKMGDAFQNFRTKQDAIARTKDYEALLAEVDKLVPALSSYAIALKAADPKKFKGKTPAEQTTSYTKANAKVKEIFGEVSGLRKNYEALAKPILGVQSALKLAKTQFASLSANSTKEQYDGFYSNAFRGINLPLKMLETVNKDPGIKAAIVTFRAQADIANKMIAGSVAFSGAAVHTAVGAAIMALTAALG